MWIENRIPGGIVYGRPRLGKTRALQYLLHVMPEEFDGRLPAFVMRCRQYARPSEGVFFEDLLRAVNHSVLSGSASAKRGRVSEAIYELARASDQDRVLLLADEAQNLHPQHYDWLTDLFNDLEAGGVSLTALLVGQPELEYQRSAFLQAKKHQIVGRFMCQAYRFRGLCSPSDVRFCLTGYDKETEYPPGSGFSFTRFYMPRAYDEGWRLATYSDEVWGAFVESRTELGLSAGSTEIPMQYFCRAVEYILRHYQTEGLEGPELSTAIVKKAIIRSGFTEAERVVS